MIYATEKSSQTGLGSIHQMDAGAPIYEDIAGDWMASQEPRTMLALTGRQKIALMLERANYSHAEIARRLGIKHRQQATRLLARAHAAEKAITKTVEDFLCPA